MTFYTYTDTPTGSLLLLSDGNVLQAAYWTVYRDTPTPTSKWVEDPTKFEEVLTQLSEYFAGNRRTFNISHKAAGTEFQKQVWDQLSQIEYAQTKSYQQIANTIGMPEAVRAVGTAIGKNPIAIIVPCHRVVASNGNLTGFAGGLESKQFLLSHEGAVVKNQLSLL